MQMKKVSNLFFAVIIFCTACSSVKTVNRSAVEHSMVKALAWQEANPIQAKAPTDWTNGAYYTGVAEAHEATGNSQFLQALTNMGTRNQWATYNRFYHADDVAISYAYLYLQSLEQPGVNLAPTAAFLQDHLHKPHPWRDGTADVKEQKILWWWCDALFMAPPVMAAYATLKNDNQYLDQMHHYYKQTYDLLYDKTERLFARDTRYQWTGAASDMKEQNGRKIFWSRGNGWVLGGLALVLQHMPAGYQHRPFYEDLFKTMADRVRGLQPKDGLWRTSLLSPESFDHGEVSGSGFFTYAMAWGVNNGLLDAKTYKPVVLRAWKALEKCQHENGKIGWVQNIGSDPKPATADSWQNYGTGAYLLAGSEILKLK